MFILVGTFTSKDSSRQLMKDGDYGQLEESVWATRNFFPRRDSLLALCVSYGLGGVIEKDLQYFINIRYFISCML